MGPGGLAAGHFSAATRTPLRAPPPATRPEPGRRPLEPSWAFGVKSMVYLWFICGLSVVNLLYLVGG